MKKVLFILSLSLMVMGLYAEGWIVESDINVTLSQSAFSDNWSGTELSNITWQASSNTNLQKQILDWLHNSNTLKLAFGQTHLQKTEGGDKYWEAPEKSTDKIDLESLWRFTLQTWVDPYVAGRIESQFLDKKQAETRYINPMNFTESAGIMRSIIEKEDTRLNARLGAAFKQKVDRDKRVAGIEETDTTMDGGAEFIAELRQNVQTPLKSSIKSRLSLYKAIFNSESDDLPNDDWKATELVWENSLSTKLFGMVSANFVLELRYDKEQVDELQWKQMLGLGLSYTLF